MTVRTLGQKFGQWVENLNRLVITLPLIFTLLGGTIYGNSETVKNFVHGNNSPLTVDAVTPEVEPKNYDRVMKELIAENKKRISENTSCQKQVNEIRLIIEGWHE